MTTRPLQQARLISTISLFTRQEAEAMDIHAQARLSELREIPCLTTTKVHALLLSSVGLLIALAGIYFFLSSQGILPSSLNAISQWGMKGKVMGALIFTTGIAMMILTIHVRQKSVIYEKSDTEKQLIAFSEGLLGSHQLTTQNRSIAQKAINRQIEKLARNPNLTADQIQNDIAREINSELILQSQRLPSERKGRL